MYSRLLRVHTGIYGLQHRSISLPEVPALLCPATCPPCLTHLQRGTHNKLPFMVTFSSFEGQGHARILLIIGRTLLNNADGRIRQT